MEMPRAEATQASSPPSAGRARAWMMFAIAACLLLAATLLGARHIATSTALESLEGLGRVDAGLKVALLRAVLERPRSLPLLLSRDRDVQEALEVPVTGRIEDLNRKLQDLVAGTNASVLYVIDRRGIALASSNWRESSSFVGSDYAFREYFSRAMRDGKAEHFALGSVSGRPGLYISQRVDSGGEPIGVVVVKAEFDQLESDWRDALRPTFVTDENGVVLVTSIPSWRFMSVGSAAPDVLRTVRESLQFGAADLTDLPTRRLQVLASGGRLIETVLPGERQARYVAVDMAVPSTPWRLHYLLPVESTLSLAIRQAQLSAVLVLAPLLGLAAIFIQRRQRALAAMTAAQAARQELERRVVERTQALTEARDRLQAEIVDHRATEERLQGVQQELVQANRLAILGQVAAGVAHEINQPVATIRAYADNARTYLERAQTGPAGENLREIATLTERIGAITEDLKALSRKGRAAPQPVALSEVMSGAAMLLKSRFAGRLDALALDLPAPDLRVLGNRLRLEQVLINLLQNALEAIEAQPNGQVHAFATVGEKTVTLVVADNGPGIEPEVLDQLFTPFASSKEAGLGLGLVIAKDIVSDYGGRISVDSSRSGTHFSVELKRADP
jgi:two-component system, NtrC family, C4-dicarboxylate transport sensor histidine kinase DctB